MTVSRQSQLRGQQSPVLGGMMRNYDPRRLGFPENHGMKLMPQLDVASAEGSIELEGTTWLEETSTYWPDGDDPTLLGDDKLELTTYKSTPHSSSRMITKRQLRHRKTVESETEYTNRLLAHLVHNFWLQIELAIMTKVTTAANFDTNHSDTLAAAEKFDQDTSDPVGVFRTMRAQQRGVMKPVTHVIMPTNVWDYLEDHADFMTYLRVKDGQVQVSDFERRFGWKLILAENMYINTSGTLTDVWSDIVGFHMPVMPGAKDPNMTVFGRTIVSDARNSKSARQWPLLGPEATVYAVGLEYTLEFGAIDNITDADSIGGYLIKDPLT